MDIALIQWPEEESRRSELANRSEPRLLLVAATAEPPSASDLLEDWVRLPAPEQDVRARVRSLEMRIKRHSPRTPRLGAQGILSRGSSSVDLTPLQARLAGRLIANIGEVVSRDQMIEAGWPDGKPTPNTVDVQMGRLRGRLAALGLVIRTVRSRGFLLETPGHGA